MLMIFRMIKRYLIDMPNKPKKIKRSWKPERKPFGRDVTNQKFYNSAKWRKAAKLHKEKNPYCAECLKSGRIRSAEFTDHIIPIKQGGESFKDENLQSLCERCHNSKSGREAH